MQMAYPDGGGPRRPAGRVGEAGEAPSADAQPGGRDAPSALQRCTQAQLRRFIKSRPYVPMHELRRRFGLNGEPDEVEPVDTREGRIWVGLPPRESGFIAELVDRGEIGLEFCHDPCVAVVVGVYSMKPVGR
jgi:hypothetical protein